MRRRKINKFSALFFFYLFYASGKGKDTICKRRVRKSDLTLVESCLKKKNKTRQKTLTWKSTGTEKL